MEFEHGFAENPLKISWLQGEKTANKEQLSNAEMEARVKQTTTTFKVLNWYIFNRLRVR